MPMILVMALALVAASVLAAVAEPTSSCKHYAARCSVPVAARKMSTTDRPKIAVLCCCKTHSGGECCIQTAQCGGKPAGCFCATPSVPAAPSAPKAITASITAQ
jgi:hypothetical protein